MGNTKIIAIALLAIGTIGLIYGGLTYTKDTDNIAADSLKFRMMKEERVNIPIALGVGCLLFGSLLFVLRNKL